MSRIQALLMNAASVVIPDYFQPPSRPYPICVDGYKGRDALGSILSGDQSDALRLTVPIDASPQAIARVLAVISANLIVRESQLALHAASIFCRKTKEAIIIVGPNLSGKTTVLQAILNSSPRFRAASTNVSYICASSAKLVAGTRLLTCRTFEQDFRLFARGVIVLPDQGLRVVHILHIMPSSEGCLVAPLLDAEVSLFNAASVIPSWLVVLSEQAIFQWPGTDNLVIERFRAVSNLAAVVPQTQITGTPNDIVTWINSNCRE